MENILIALVNMYCEFTMVVTTEISKSLFGILGLFIINSILKEIGFYLESH